MESPACCLTTGRWHVVQWCLQSIQKAFATRKKDALISPPQCSFYTAEHRGREQPGGLSPGCLSQHYSAGPLHCQTGCSGLTESLHKSHRLAGDKRQHTGSKEQIDKDKRHHTCSKEQQGISLIQFRSFNKDTFLDHLITILSNFQACCCFPATSEKSASWRILWAASHPAFD